MEKSKETQKLLTTYLRRLTNLSGNNRSLYLPRLIGDQFLDVHELSQLNKEKSFAIIESLIAGKKKILCAVLDARMEAVGEASKKLKKLQRLDHFLFEERGSRDLHIGWPFVRGKFTDGTFVRCPLLFFPVELVIENDQWVLHLREDGDITFNKSFLLAHSLYNEVKADDTLLEETFEEADKDSTVFRTAIYQLLQKSNIDVHFNPDNFRDELTSFLTYKKEDFDKDHFNGELKLFPEAVLGIFPQAGSYLIPDYKELIDKDKVSDLEHFFAERSGVRSEQTNFLNDVKEEKVYPAFTMDAWQENALKAVKVGHSLIVQGPPGTGKSQLICNLIADGLAHGKKILVVCQKRAALDVVYNRLSGKRMNDFLALVHDFKNDRKEIFAKAAKQVDQIEEYKSRNNSIDSIQLERKFFTTSRKIDQITEELEEFRKSLFDESDCGYSAKELYLLSDSSAPSVNLKQEYNLFTRLTLEAFLARLKRYVQYAIRFKASGYAWGERKSFANWSLQNQRAIEQALKEIEPYFVKLQEELHQALSARPDWEHCEEFWKNQSRASDMLRQLADKNAYTYFQFISTHSDEETSSLWLANQSRVINECFKGLGVERSIPALQLGDFQQALGKTVRMRKGILSRMYWEFFFKDKSIIKSTLLANNLKLSKEGLETLERKLDNRLNLEHNLSKLRATSWLKEIPESYSEEVFTIWFDQYQKAIRAKLIFNYIRGLKNFIDPVYLNAKEFQARMENLYRPLYLLQQKKEEWQHHFTSSQIEKITRDAALAGLLRSSLKNDFDSLCEFDQLEESFSVDERKVIDRLVDAAGGYETISALFLNSVYIGWLDHLEVKYPILRIPTSEKLFSLERDLRHLIEEKEKLSNEILLLRARERVIDNMEFNRLNNRVTYRDLHHQLTKKKKIWPVRKVISEYEEEIFRLLPCWLTSPESASAIFPMKEMFDLVIFDEASQCFAEQGIPSLYRAKQAVIAGDSQQLRPSDVYLSRWQEEETEHPDLEVNSLLELGSRYLMSITLQGHYRSKSLELIEFSNRHFYKGKLYLLPDRHAFNAPDPAIEYIKVDGVWEDNANQAEADQIAELVISYHQRHPQKEIGVVTFNATQQALVLDVLEEKFAELHVPLPPSLFVKNIENVQGDERDVIIFSIGYARDKKKKLNAQFGSLNLAGGENRLNVAVTRAREKIIVVASIQAEDLKVDDTRNDGPKLLKEYLNYAWHTSQGLKYRHESKETVYSQFDSLQLKNIIQEDLPSKTDAVIEDETVPFADLAVKREDKYQSLVRTDDDLYFQSMSAKAWHAQIPVLFESKNWKYTMAYSRNYWIDREKFLNDVSRSI